MITIRKETADDIAAIRNINEQAFAGTDEARLVEQLREAGKATISLVALDRSQVVGHILFSPVTLSADETHSLKAAGLAPMAVLPEFQNRGIGSRLVNAGLAECRKAGFDCVVVLGHPHFYPRFGFVPSVQYHLKSEFAVPDEVFMVLELTEGGLKNRAGIVKYQPEFDNF